MLERLVGFVVVLAMSGASACAFQSSGPENHKLYGSVNADADRPYSLLIYHRSPWVTPACAGALMNARHVLTAKHCASDAKNDYVVLFGSSQRQVDVRQWHLYEPDAPLHQAPDIAIAELEEPVSVSRYPSFGQSPDGEFEVVAVSWLHNGVGQSERGA